MANQDYISRPAPKKKNNNRRGKKTVKKSSSLPLKSKIMSLVLLVLIGLFVYFLWSLKTDPETKVPLITPVKTADTKKVVNQERELPKPPKEQWTYVEDLKNKKVEVGEYTVEEKGPYKMQCGSFRTLEQANSLKAKIAFAGLESQVKAVTGKNGTWHKVFLGPYKRKRAAEKDKHKLKRNSINHCQIWGWR